MSDAGKPGDVAKPAGASQAAGAGEPAEVARPAEAGKPGKKGGDSGGAEARGYETHGDAAGLPIAARDYALEVPEAWAAVARSQRLRTLLYLAAAGAAGAVLLPGPLALALVVGIAWRARRVLAPARPLKGASSAVRAEEEGEESGAATEAPSVYITICIPCGATYRYGRVRGFDGRRVLMPRGCAGCGRSVCLACSKVRAPEADGVVPAASPAAAEAVAVAGAGDAGEGEAVVKPGLPRVTRYCVLCADEEARFEL